MGARRGEQGGAVALPWKLIKKKFFSQMASMVCTKFLSKKAPMICVKFSPKGPPHVER